MNTKLKNSLVSFAEGAIIPYIPLLYATIAHVLPNYFSGIALAFITGIINVVYDTYFKKSNVSTTTSVK